MAETTPAGRLAGRVALVTGAASEIAVACARRFREEGAMVVGFDLEHPLRALIAVPDEVEGCGVDVLPWTAGMWAWPSWWSEMVGAPLRSAPCRSMA